MTTVGYIHFNDHRHDDNCVNSTFTCAAGHKTKLSLRRTCPIPGCEWRGKPTCFCHEGEKVDRWPKIVEPISTEKQLALKKGSNE